MEEPQDLKRYQILFSPLDISYLEKINENISTATRKLVHDSRNQKKNQILDRHLMIFAIGLLFIAFSTLMTHQFIIAIIAGIGIIYIVYSTTSIVRWKLRK